MRAEEKEWGKVQGKEKVLEMELPMIETGISLSKDFFHPNSRAQFH